MATIAIDGRDLVVRMSRLEQVAALRREVRVPRKAVRAVRVAARPWDELRGVRAPGMGIPRVIMLGATRGRGGAQFAAVYGNRPAVIVELGGAGLSRLIVSMPDAESAAAALGRL